MHSLEQDKFKDECGVIGVWNHREAANLAYLALYAQQHRGQEGAGVVSYDSSNANQSVHRGMGLVSDVFNNFDFSKLPGSCSIGHVRYSTFGSNNLSNVQPFTAETAVGRMALAHNGNLTNGSALRKELIDDGAICSTTSDSEVMLHLISRNLKDVDVKEAVIRALKRVRGAYSLVVLFEDRLIAARDPSGFRPLALGRLNGSYVVASESCAFDLIEAKYLREIEAGEVVEIASSASGESSILSTKPFAPSRVTPCIFEYVYFARPDSTIYGRNVYKVRKELGRRLAVEAPAVCDLVVPVPDSGVPAALGYAEQIGTPFELALIRNHYVGRTFIEPKQSIRDFGVKVKLNPNREVLEGKRIVVVDDSIVRGTTTQKLVAMLRSSGATEVHVRISAPPTTDPCHYGIDTPEKSQLIASTRKVQEISDYIGADSLQYLSRAGMYAAVGAKEDSFCDACFTGRYPVLIES